MNGIRRLKSNETIYREMEPVTSTRKENIISLLGHLIRTHKNGIRNTIIEKLWNNESYIAFVDCRDQGDLHITINNRGS